VAKKRVIPDIDDIATSRAIGSIVQWLTELTNEQAEQTADELITLDPKPNISLDGSGGLKFKVELDQNVAVADLTGVSPGDLVSLSLVQDATGSRTASWASSWKFDGGSKPLSTAAGSIDFVSGRVESTDVNGNATIVIARLTKAHS
jgi:hypothetical protein